MKIFGGIFRYVLNINTIWAWMILIAFVVCAIRHYVPAITAVPPEAFVEGENLVTFTVPDREGNDLQFSFPVTKAKDIYQISEPAEEVKSAEVVKFSRVSVKPNNLYLIWDYKLDGNFKITVRENEVAKGKLANLKTFSDAATEYAEIAFNLAFGFIPIFIMFLGLMRVGEDAGIVGAVAKAFYPVIRFLFPEVPKDHPANGAIVMNVTTTILGLGNAATPFGLKAMEHLEELNPHKGVATNAQVMLLGYNTAGLALLPTTLIALRQSAGVDDPFAIIGPCFVAGAVSTTVAIVMAKLLQNLPVFSIEAAHREHLQELAEEEAKKKAADPDADAKKEDKE